MPSSIEPPAIWFTGEPGSGKSTIASTLALLCRTEYVPAVLFDGDRVRERRARAGRPAGWSEGDRREHAVEIARTMAGARASGRVTIAAVVAPTRAIRAAVSEVLPGVRWVCCWAPQAVIEKRRGALRELATRAGTWIEYEPPTDATMIRTDTGAPPMFLAENTFNNWIGKVPE